MLSGPLSALLVAPLVAVVLMPLLLSVGGGRVGLDVATSARTGPLLTDPSRVALLVSAAGHHYEIAAFFADHLHSLDMDLHIWLHEFADVAYDNVMQRVFSHYSSNISRIVDNMEQFVPKKIKLLVYVTMNTRKEVKALCPRRRLHEALFDRAESVLMVNHHSKTVDNVLAYCRPPKCSIVHLGFHVDADARRLLSSTAQRRPPKSKKAAAATAAAAASISADFQSLVLQPIFQPPMAAQLLSHVESALQSFSNRTRIVAVQGTMVQYRRNYSALFSCVQNLRTEGHDVRLFLLGTQAKRLTIPGEMRPVVTMVRSSSHEQFYATIGRAHLLAMFGNPDMHYDTERATSTVPTGVMSETPVVLTRHMLSIYPCLYSSPVHRRIAQTEDCASLSAAVRLSDTDLAALREETKHCNRQWRHQSRSVLKAFIAAATPAPSAGTNKECCRCTDDIMSPVPR